MKETNLNKDILFEDGNIIYEIVTDKDNLNNSYIKITNKNKKYKLNLVNPSNSKIDIEIINKLVDYLNLDDYILDNNDKVIAKVKKWNRILFDLNTEYNFYLYMDYKLRYMYKYKTLYKYRNKKRLLSKGFLDIDMTMPDYKGLNNA